MRCPGAKSGANVNFCILMPKLNSSLKSHEQFHWHSSVQGSIVVTVSWLVEMPISTLSTNIINRFLPDTSDTAVEAIKTHSK